MQRDGAVNQNWRAQGRGLQEIAPSSSPWVGRYPTDDRNAARADDRRRGSDGGFPWQSGRTRRLTQIRVQPESPAQPASCPSSARFARETSHRDSAHLARCCSCRSDPLQLDARVLPARSHARAEPPESPAQAPQAQGLVHGGVMRSACAEWSSDEDNRTTDDRPHTIATIPV